MTDLNSLCDEWGDDERMRVMFAPLRSKELNPESWNSKILFWETLIKKYCVANNVCSISLDQLESVFTRAGTSPHCLEQVVTECVRRGDMLDTGRYKQQVVAQASWSSWVKSIGWKAVQSVGDSVLGHNPNSLTIPDIADKLMDTLHQHLKSQESDIVRNECLILEESKLGFLQDGCNKELLQYLVLKKKVAIENIDSVQYLKVSIAAKSSPVCFDESDVCVVKLKKTISALDSDIDKSEVEVKTLREKVKQLLKSESRMTAKNTLKRQKLVESSLQKKLDQKFNLETILDEILGAEANKTVVKSYKAGLDELKSKLKELSAENVDDVLNEITEVMEEGETLSQSICRNIQDDSLDMDELEKELQNLSQEESDLDLSKELKTSMTEEDTELLAALDNLEIHNLEPEIGTEEARNKVALTS